jgi:penicillin-binding protein 1A
MVAAHQNLEIRPIPGASPANANRVASSKGQAADQAQAPAQAYLAGTLSRRSYEVLGDIGSLFQSVERPLSTGKAPEAPRSSASADARRQVAMP